MAKTSVINYTPPAIIREFIKHYEQGAPFMSFIIGPVGCLPADSEFLTPRGWKRMDKYVKGDAVAVWSDGRVFFDPSTEYVDLPAGTPFYRFDSGSLDMVLSPEHRVLYQDYKGDLKVVTAEEMAAHPSKRTIPTTFRLSSTDSPITDAEIRLRVMFSADGHIPATGNKVMVTVRKERKKARLRQLLEACGIPHTERTYDGRPTETVFSFEWSGASKSLNFVWALSSRQLAIVTEECLHWDGLHDHEEKRYYTTIQDHADAIQFAAHATGYRASIHTYDDPRSPEWNRMYTVSIRAADNAKNCACVRRDSTEISVVPSEDGRKYCFHTSTGFFVARHNGTVFVTGNSGKTTGNFFKLLHMAMKQAPSPLDGIRRSKCLIVRNTFPQLHDTTIPSWNYWFKDGQAGSWMKTTNTFNLKFGDVECEVLFRALDTPDDVARVLSMEVTFVILDEFVLIPKEIVEAISSRAGRYPSAVDGGATNWGVWGASNPGNETDWWYDWFYGETPLDDNIRLFEQPSGLSPHAENIENLPGKEKYYEQLIKGKSSAWIKQFVEVTWGYSQNGKPVWPMFNPALHISPTTLTPNPALQLCIGFDPGMSGSAFLIGQEDHHGRLIVYDEIVLSGVGTERGITDYLRPLLSRKYKGYDVEIAPDPAANNRASSNERTSVDILRKFKFNVNTRDTNNTLAPRLEAVEHYLSRLTDVGPALLIDPSCKHLIRAMQGGYRFTTIKNGDKTSETPDKNQHSHVADGLQYLAKNRRTNTEKAGRMKAAGFKPPMFKNVYLQR